MRKVEEKGNIEGREGKGETFPWKIGGIAAFQLVPVGEWKRTLTAYMEETNGGWK